MTRSAVALVLCWATGVGAAALAISSAQSGAADGMLQHFDQRADAGAALVSAYAKYVAAAEQRVSDGLSRDPSPATLVELVTNAGFSSAFIVDRHGQVLLSTSRPAAAQWSIMGPVAGAVAAARRDAGDPVWVGTTVPGSVALATATGRGRQVLLAETDLRRSPLRSFLSVAPFAGTANYLLDADGAVLMAGGSATDAEPADLDIGAALSAPTTRAGRVAVAAPVPGTPWRLVMTAPQSEVTGPVQLHDAIAWEVLAGTALVTLIGVGMLARVLASRQRAADDQARSEQQFRLTLDNAPIGITLVTLEGFFRHPNAQLQTILGYDADELSRLRFADITHPDDLDADLALIDAVLAGEIPNYQMEKRYLHKDGQVVWAKLSVAVVRDSAGRALHFVSQVEDVTAIRAAQEELQRRALYDPLTGLANRNLLLDRLTHLLVRRDRDGGKVAVAFCDLDHFKRVNDSLGHRVGDLLLQEVARRLQHAVRGGDTVARMGGDEFVLVLGDVGSEREAALVLDRVKEAVEAPIEVDGQMLLVSFSAGLAVGDSRQSAEALLRDADTALYSAKERGRSRWELFTAAMRQRALAQLSVEAELRKAIDEDSFEVHYQPIVDLQSGHMVAYEALVRWVHPRRGLVLPGAFLDVAEESQLILPLGRLVLRHACEFVARHPSADWRVFVNVSPVQIGRNLVGAVTAELAAAGVPPARLGLEITETGVLDATGSCLSEMEQLADMGVSLLMDDFGTGYSALTSVLSAPIAGIKLDRSFTARLGDGSTGDRITATVADLVASIGAYGVVEGIETEQQRLLALQYGWRHGQGYLLGRPAPESHLGLNAEGRRTVEPLPPDVVRLPAPDDALATQSPTSLRPPPVLGGAR